MRGFPHPRASAFSDGPWPVGETVSGFSGGPVRCVGCSGPGCRVCGGLGTFAPAGEHSFRPTSLLGEALAASMIRVTIRTSQGHAVLGPELLPPALTLAEVCDRARATRLGPMKSRAGRRQAMRQLEVQLFLDGQELYGDSLRLERLERGGFLELTAVFTPDKVVTLASVRRNGMALEEAHEALRGDRDVVVEAVRQNGRALYFADAALKADKQVVTEAVRQDGFALEFADEPLRSFSDIVREAVAQNGCALRFAHDALRIDRVLSLQAVRQTGLSLEFAHEAIIADREVVGEAIRENGLALEFAHPILRGDKDLVMEAVRNNGYALQFATLELQADQDVRAQAKQNLPYSGRSTQKPGAGPLSVDTESTGLPPPRQIHREICSPSGSFSTAGRTGTPAEERDPDRFAPPLRAANTPRSVTPRSATPRTARQLGPPQPCAPCVSARPGYVSPAPARGLLPGPPTPCVSVRGDGGSVRRVRPGVPDRARSPSPMPMNAVAQFWLTT